MQNFPGKTLAVLARDVRKIRDNHIETSLHIFQQIAFQKADAVVQLYLGSIVLRQCERIIRNVHSENLRFGEFHCQSERNNSAAGSHIHDSQLSIFDFRFYELNQFLRFRPGHHRALIAEKYKSTKFSRAQQMLKRLALAATLHQIAQWRELGFSQHTLKFQVQLYSFPSERVREQMLSI